MGRLYWITGYSGAGKTTIGRELYKMLKQKRESVVFLDGDELRSAISGDLGYSLEERRQSALRFSGLCKLLTAQGLDLICCTVSMFDEVREWNRANIGDYVEVYIKVSIEVLRERDQKGLYSSDEPNVVGVDLASDEPKNPHITIENDGSLSPEAVAEMIYKGESYYVK